MFLQLTNTRKRGQREYENYFVKEDESKAIPNTSFDKKAQILPQDAILFNKDAQQRSTADGRSKVATFES